MDGLCRVRTYRGRVRGILASRPSHALLESQVVLRLNATSPTTWGYKTTQSIARVSNILPDSLRSVRILQGLCNISSWTASDRTPTGRDCRFHGPFPIAGGPSWRDSSACFAAAFPRMARPQQAGGGALQVLQRQCHVGPECPYPDVPFSLLWRRLCSSYHLNRHPRGASQSRCPAIFLRGPRWRLTKLDDCSHADGQAVYLRQHVGTREG